ncbi:hypothetical protein BDZ97DRAFT_1913489 [Flammula alnicola]|nr:hypothetical protein BDZ97DRAFT_1913489 [Flammula alnicola]
MPELAGYASGQHRDERSSLYLSYNPSWYVHPSNKVHVDSHVPAQDDEDGAYYGQHFSPYPSLLLWIHTVKTVRVGQRSRRPKLKAVTLRCIRECLGIAMIFALAPGDSRKAWSQEDSGRAYRGPECCSFFGPTKKYWVSGRMDSRQCSGVVDDSCDGMEQEIPVC